MAGNRRTRGAGNVRGRNFAGVWCMGIPVGGKTLSIGREQTERISRCRLTFEARHGNRVGMANQSIMDSAIFLDAPTEDQVGLPPRSWTAIVTLLW
jgi:hypothetical protein